MRGQRVLFSSEKQDWRTPEDLYHGLDEEFSFDFDPCPPDPQFDGLSVDWGTSNFVNPPYDEIPKWLAKGYHEWQDGKASVFLLPSRTDTRWWHEFVMKASEIRFIKGRLKFSGHENSAPFPSCLVIFR